MQRIKSLSHLRDGDRVHVVPDSDYPEDWYEGVVDGVYHKGASGNKYAFVMMDCSTVYAGGAPVVVDPPRRVAAHRLDTIYRL